MSIKISVKIFKIKFKNINNIINQNNNKKKIRIIL